MADKITGKETIKKVVDEYPETVDVFFRHGMHCISCPVASGESIEDGAKVHGIDIKKLVDDLNKAVEKK